MIQEIKFNTDEELFFNELFCIVSDGIRLERLSDGTINVLYHTYQIGRIKLNGRKHKMQILKGLYGVKWIEGDVYDFIPHIQDWIKYMKWVIK